MPGKIVIISGLPGSGKSTLASAMAARVDKGIHLEVDKIRSMFVNDVIDPAETRQWSEEIESQFRLERQAAGQMAALFAHQGFTTIIDDLFLPPYLLNHYEPYLSGFHSTNILLNPSMDSVIRRLKSRKDMFDGTFIDRLPALHHLLTNSDLTGWSVLDSSNLSQEETLQEALAILSKDAPSSV